MPNRVIDKIKIDGAILRQEIERAGYSLRKLGEEIHCSDRQIRYYLSISEMPGYMYCGIRKFVPDSLSHMDKYGSLYKRLQNGIATANKVDSDFVYIQISDAKQIIEIIERINQCNEE